MHFHEMFQKSRYFPNNISAIFLKYNEYGFLMSIEINISSLEILIRHVLNIEISLLNIE